MRLFTVLLIALGVLLSACSSGERSNSSGAKDPKGFLRQIKLTDLAGNPVSLDDYRGKGVALNLWATWCRPCVLEMPSMERQRKQLDNVVILAASNEPTELIRQFQNATGYGFEFAHMVTPFQQLNVRSIPTTYLIDKEGNLQNIHTGMLDWEDPVFAAELETLGR